MKTLTADDFINHLVRIHWGYRGIAEDAGKTSLMTANQLSPAAIDPNAYTPEFKGFLVKIEKA